MSENPKPSLGIIGLGTIGGSLALGARGRDATRSILGVDMDPSACKRASSTRAVDDASTEVTSALGACDIVVLCTPLGAMRAVLTALRPLLGPQTVLTDVAGVKTIVQTWAQELAPEALFVGGHPMAGAQSGGFGAARADLFEGAPVALCPGLDNPEALGRVSALWRSLGATPHVMSAEAHDARVARTSHLPYLSVLAQLHGMDSEDAQLLGPGFDNASRYAEYEPEIMASVATANPCLPDAVRTLAHELLRIAETLDGGSDELLKYAERAKRKRRALLS